MTANGSGSRIRVFDESGEWIGTTYPKRARGLVKNGRARWLADETNASDPVMIPDSIVLTRQSAGAEEDLSPRNIFETDREENIMNEFNNNTNKSENEIRIEAMIAKFQEDMAKAREIAEKAAAEAREAMEQTRAAEAEKKEGGRTVGETLCDLGAKLNEAAETVCGEIREAASEIAANENVREAAGTVKNAGEAVLSEAKKKLKEAEERLAEARKAYEDAERAVPEDEPAETGAEEEKADDGECGECDVSARIKENMKQLADEAGEAMKVAWTELKKGWKELSAASAESFEWLKENTKDARTTVKDAFREFGESVKSMMDDVGTCGECGGDGTEEQEDEECGRGTPEIEIEEVEVPAEPEAPAEPEVPAEPSASPAFDKAQAEAMNTASAIRAEAAAAARKSIEEEIASVKDRVDGILSLIKDKCASGEITVEQYMEYNDKYTAFLHDRLAELREELKNI